MSPQWNPFRNPGSVQSLLKVMNISETVQFAAIEKETGEQPAKGAHEPQSAGAKKVLCLQGAC